MYLLVLFGILIYFQVFGFAGAGTACRGHGTCDSETSRGHILALFLFYRVRVDLSGSFSLCVAFFSVFLFVITDGWRSYQLDQRMIEGTVERSERF